MVLGIIFDLSSSWNSFTLELNLIEHKLVFSMVSKNISEQRDLNQ